MIIIFLRGKVVAKISLSRAIQVKHKYSKITL